MSDIPAPIPDKKPYERLLVFMRCVVWYAQPFLICALFCGWIYLAGQIRFLVNGSLRDSDFLNILLDTVKDALATLLLILLIGQLRDVRDQLKMNTWQDLFTAIYCGILVGFFIQLINFTVCHSAQNFHGSFPLIWIHNISSYPMSAMWLVIILMAGWEEVFWRGIVLKSLLKRMGKNPALLISGILFAFWHLLGAQRTGGEVFFLALDGILWGSIYIGTRRLWPAILCHGTMNFLLCSDWDGYVNGAHPLMNRTLITSWQQLIICIMLPLIVSAGFLFYYKKTKAFHA